MDKIGKKTSKLLSALEGRKITQTQYGIIAHPSVNDRTNCGEELDKLHNRGLIHREKSYDDTILYTISPKGQHLLNEYRS